MKKIGDIFHSVPILLSDVSNRTQDKKSLVLDVTF